MTQMKLICVIYFEKEAAVISILLICESFKLSAGERQALINLLPPERRERFISSKRQNDEVLFAYTLVRHAFDMLDSENDMPEIVYSEAGKPAFKNADLHFSISHTNGCAICAMSRLPTGCDVERIRPVKQSLAKKVLPEKEFECYLHEESLETHFKEACFKETRFFEYWTKLESALKKTGTGLSGGIKFDEDESYETFLHNEYIISVCTDDLPVYKYLYDNQQKAYITNG